MSFFEGALPPPKGVTPDFTNPQNKDAQIHIVAGVCISTATLLVLARTYTRLFVIKRRGWQDYILLAAWVLSLIYLILLPIGTRYGAGIHQWNITQAQYVEFAQKANLTSILYSPVMCLIKLAILIQLASVFAPSKGRMYWIIVVISVLTVAFYFTSTLFRALQCIPRAKIWQPSLPGRCINSAAGILSSAVLNTVSDFVLLLLPLSRIWTLQMPRRRKWAVSAVFAVGIFGCASSIFRLVASVHLLQNGDETYEITLVGLWCDAEITSGIACCCLPVLPQFYRKHLSALVASLRTRLQSATGSSGTEVLGVRGGPLGRKADGSRPQNNNDYVELDDLGGKKDSLAISKYGGEAIVKLPQDEIEHGNLEIDVEMGRTKVTATVDLESKSF